MDLPLKVGVSACLLGQPVRFDGGHKHDRWITDVLGRHVVFVPVCPEVEAGFGVPRESMRLVGDPDAPRLLTTRTGRDLTDAMTAWAARRAQELAAENLCGFIFKSRSPSSGMSRVKVYSPTGGMPSHTGVGLFARAFMQRFPLLPVEEEGRLNDAKLRENFIERLFVMRRWRSLLEEPGQGQPPRPAALIAFHAAHKLLIMSHSTTDLRALGKLTARVKDIPAGELYPAYQDILLAALAKPATVAKHVNVLQHAAGYFRGKATPEDRAELADAIELYRQALVPLIVPVTLCNHHVRKHRVDYLAQQYYLHPHPIDLKLRNHV